MPLASLKMEKKKDFPLQTNFCDAPNIDQNKNEKLKMCLTPNRLFECQVLVT